MNQKKLFYVYIITNHPGNTLLCTGVGSNIFENGWQPKVKMSKKNFADDYKIDKVVFYEIFSEIFDATAREKQIRKFSRWEKEIMINEINPRWDNLLNQMYDPI